MRLKQRLSQWLMVACAVSSTLLTGCAVNHNNPQDPYESYNRKVFKFNKGVDKVIYRPVAVVYTTVIPKFARKGVSNFLSNVNEVPTISNDILQANPLWALSDIGRLVINTTLGIGGLFDIATRAGLEKHDQDFGLTMAKWGYTKSSYLLIPFFPPSTVRDLIGTGGDYATTVWTYVRPGWIGWTAYGVTLVDKRASFLDSDKLVDQAFDPYIFVRDAYLQNRQHKLNKVMHPKGEDGGFSDDLASSDSGSDEATSAAKTAPAGHHS